MNLILDTHALLWFLVGDPRISRKARKAIEHADTTNFISMASWWEIAIKFGLGKLHLEGSVEDLMQDCIRQGFRPIPVEPHHIPPLLTLPFHHRDPFDRMIISQAITEKMLVCSADPSFSAYPVTLIW